MYLGIPEASDPNARRSFRGASKLESEVVDLIEVGVVTNRPRNVHRGRTVTSLVSGSRRLFDFVNDNPFIEFHPCDCDQ
jgi:acyl-CoA hydrolase